MSLFVFLCDTKAYKNALKRGSPVTDREFPVGYSWGRAQTLFNHIRKKNHATAKPPKSANGIVTAI